MVGVAGVVGVVAAALVAGVSGIVAAPIVAGVAGIVVASIVASVVGVVGIIIAPIVASIVGIVRVVAAVALVLLVVSAGLVVVVVLVREIGVGRVGVARVVLLTGVVGGTPKQALLGKEGEVLSELRPSGAVLLDGVPVDVVSEGAFISKGEKVRVVAVEGVRVVVRRV